MKHLLELEKRIKADPHNVSEIEWVIHIAFQDGKGALDKHACDKAAAELEALRAVNEVARFIVDNKSDFIKDDITRWTIDKLANALEAWKAAK